MSKSGLSRALRLEAGAPARDRRDGERDLPGGGDEPALGAPAGRERLIALCDGYFSHLEREVFPGGCFFAAAAADFDTRSGPVRDAIAAAYTGLDELLQELAADARSRGEIAADTDLTQLAFDSAGFSSLPTPPMCSSGTPARSTRAGRPCAHVWPSERARWLASEDALPGRPLRLRRDADRLRVDHPRLDSPCDEDRARARHPRRGARPSRRRLRPDRADAACSTPTASTSSSRATGNTTSRCTTSSRRSRHDAAC